MTYLFVSTDSSEAKKLLEGLGSRGFQYHDIDVNTGERLKRRIGFNPMCSITLNGAQPSYVAKSTALLLRERLYVVAENDGEVIKYSVPATWKPTSGKGFPNFQLLFQD